MQVQSMGWSMVKSPGIGNGTLLQYSCLENFMDKGSWQATVPGVTKSWTWLGTHTHTCSIFTSNTYNLCIWSICIIYICIYNVLYIFSYTYWNIGTHTYKHCISLLLHILFIYSLDLKDFYTFLPNFLALYVLWLLVNLNTFSSSITIYGLLSKSVLNVLQF